MTAPLDTQPVPSAESVREADYTWNELLGMVLSHRRQLVKANLIAIVGAALAVPIPLLIPLLVDEVLLDRPGRSVAMINAVFPQSWHSPVLYIGVILLLTLAMRFGAMVLGVIQTRQFTGISKDVTYRIRRDLLLRLRQVSMAEYETLGSGTVASHLVTDVNALDELIGVATSKLLVAVLSILGTALVLIWMHWPLAVFILLMNPIVIYVTTVFGRKVKTLKARENTAYQLFQEALGETLDAIQQIRASNRERHYIARVIDRADAIRHRSGAFAWKSDAANRLSFLIFLFGFDIFRATSMLMVVYSDLTIGQMLAVFSYLWFMMQPVQEVVDMQYKQHAAQAALSRINALMRVRLEPRYPHLHDPFRGKLTTSVRLQDIHFAYGDGPPVLDGISLSIAAGQKVALVGASGGGKTTLVQIILGLYTPVSGQVLFDEVPVTEIGMDLVRNHVATVLQHPALLNDSVRMNLTLGKALSDRRLWQALEIAQLRELVEAMDQGLDTLIGRDGVRLSGGQRQRLAVARMVLTDPRVVILDEATSALDAATEQRLHTALRTFLAGRTTLIIAHRLSAVRQADRTLVFDAGRIIEQGTHAELLQKQGLYARLYDRQQR